MRLTLLHVTLFYFLLVMQADASITDDVNILIIHYNVCILIIVIMHRYPLSSECTVHLPRTFSHHPHIRVKRIQANTTCKMARSCSSQQCMIKRCNVIQQKSSCVVQLAMRLTRDHLVPGSIPRACADALYPAAAPLRCAVDSLLANESAGGTRFNTILYNIIYII
jgi:hypothetical protein